MIKLLIFIIIMGAIIGLFWYDEIKLWVSEHQEEVEEKAPQFINQGLDQAKNWWESQGQDWADQFVANLTSKGKVKIDEWLEEENLNEYGDPEGTTYDSGTPLEDESTSETADRYSYILEKFPELIQSLNLEDYLKNY